MLNFKNPVFSKLYRYYCAKLLKKIWVSVFYFGYFLLMLVMMDKHNKKMFDNINGWREKLVVFWLISLFIFFILLIMVFPLISHLVGRGSGWEELRRGRLFSMPKISQEEDIKVLLFTPKVDRKTVIWAKFATAFTYFMTFNFFLTSSLVIYFLATTNLGLIANFSFLLLNGVGFGLVNFCLLVPFLFYQQETGSYLVYLSLYVFLMFMLIVYFFGKDFFRQYPLVFGLLFVPFFFLAGYFFFSLYQKKFLNKDLA